MATLGLVTVLERGEVLLKVSASCNGGRGEVLAKLIDSRQLRRAHDVHHLAWLEVGFGCKDCLVVQCLDAEGRLGNYHFGPGLSSSSSYGRLDIFRRLQWHPHDAEYVPRLGFYVVHLCPLPPLENDPCPSVKAVPSTNPG